VGRREREGGREGDRERERESKREREETEAAGFIF
jgi:hypothetical protein